MNIIKRNAFSNSYGIYYNLAEEKQQKRTIKVRVIDGLTVVKEELMVTILFPDVYYLSYYSCPVNHLYLVDKRNPDQFISFQNCLSTNCIPGDYLGIQKLVDKFWTTPFDICSSFEGIRFVKSEKFAQMIKEAKDG